MSRPRISTGSVFFPGRRRADAPPLRSADDALHMAVIGDFSGRGSRGEEQLEELPRRRAFEIDRDNFDAVFARLDVRLQLPFEERPLALREIDDLHPDVLLEQLDLFSEFRRLQRQLRSRDGFDRAAAEIRGWAGGTDRDDGAAAPAPAQERADAAPPEDLFDAVLSESREQADAAMQSAGNVNRLIQAIVAPYIEPRENPERARYQAALDEAMAQALRRIMHSGAFQRLEANWRALQLLVSRLETDPQLKLFLLDVSQQELLDDAINADSVEDMALCRRLLQEQEVPGATPFAVLNVELVIDDDIDRLRLAAALGQIAERSGSLAVCSASGHLAGCADLGAREDVDDWDYAVDETTLAGWQAYRDDSSARHLIACAPRFLVRLPYGRRGEAIEHFPFEELGGERRHEYYCWAPGAYLLTLALGQAFSLGGWAELLGGVSEIEEIPVHVYTDDDGDSCAMPCAEVFLRDPAAEALAKVGICSLRSIRGRDAVAIPHKRSVHRSGEIASVVPRGV